MSRFLLVALLALLLHHSLGDPVLQTTSEPKPDGLVLEQDEASFLPPMMHSGLQRKRSSFMALRGKKFPVGIPLFGWKRASAYIPVRGRRFGAEDLSENEMDKRASSFYVGRGKKSEDMERYLPLDDGFRREQLMDPGFGDREHEMQSWMPGDEDVVQKRIQAFFGSRGKRSPRSP